MAPGTADRVEGLVALLGRRCDPRALDVHSAAPAAVLASSPLAPGLAGSLAGPGAVAVWVHDGSELARLERLPGEPDVVVTPSPLVADAAGDRAVVVPKGGVDAAAFAPVAPFVRARWRRRGGLPDELVVGAGVPGGPPLAGVALGTALAVCAAAAVAGPWLVPALAVGTPLVTTPAAAGGLDLAGTGAALVAPVEDALPLACELAADEVRAAALSQGGRRFVEGHLDLGRPGDDLAARLGLHAGPRPVDAVGAALAELGTPSGAGPARRAADALAGLLGPPLPVGG